MFLVSALKHQSLTRRWSLDENFVFSDQSCLVLCDNRQTYWWNMTPMGL